MTDAEIIEVATKILYPGGRTTRVVAPSRWIPIYEMRRAGRAPKTIAREEGCSAGWIRCIVRAVSIAVGTYEPNDWFERIREQRKLDRAEFRAVMDERTEQNALDKRMNARIREGLPAFEPEQPVRRGWDPAVHGKGSW